MAPFYKKGEYLYYLTHKLFKYDTNIYYMRDYSRRRDSNRH